ncbi:MAG: GntR family transcriptional regulator [Sphingomonas sp.]|uniref:GntR family transcriptional regulator n=1 Tax=Sphingomonas sp. TaxID=28214 RepID=UPI0025D9E2E8|nr:GntR family transcriptional regulator [Sphingomonas sp.]MBQ1499153.1 GntR family transcriptional regulator [Sphingomonas sp.]
MPRSSPERGGSRAGARIPADELAEHCLQRILTGGCLPGARITERWIVDQFAVTHSQAREALHFLEKRGALTLAPLRGATLVDSAQFDPADVRPVWVALVQLAIDLAEARAVTPRRIPSLDGDTPWDSFVAIEQSLNALGEASGNARLISALQKLAVQTMTAHRDAGPIDPRALQSLVSALSAEHAATAAQIDRTFAAAGSGNGAARAGEQMLRGALATPPLESGHLTPRIRTYFDRVAAAIGPVPDGALPAARQLAATIAQRIQFGELRPGDAVRELPLALAFGVSRGPVRDALRILDRHGLIALEGRRGAFVRRFSIDAAVDIAQVRAALSGVQMAVAAAAPARAEWVDSALREGVDLLEAIAEDDACPLGSYILVRRAVAIVTLAAGGNVVVGRLAAELEAEVTTLWATVLSKERQRKSAATWRLIADAIIERDVERARREGKRIVEEAFAAALQVAELQS